jgi:hypothetical protein
MLDNNKNIPVGNDNINPAAHPEEDSPQQILDKRLAEISARKQDTNNPEPATGGLADEPAPHQLNLPGTPVSGIEESTPASDSISVEDVPGTAAAITPEPETGFPFGVIESKVTNQTEEVSGLEADLTSENDVSPTEPLSETISDAVESPQPSASSDSSDAGANDSAVEPEPAEDLSTAGIIPEQTPDEPQVLPANPEAGSPEVTAVLDHPDEDHPDDYIPETDYSIMTLPELRNQLLRAYKTSDPRKNARQIFEMYRQFELRLANERQEALNRFIADGGEAEGFSFHSGPENQEIERGFQQFRENRNRELRNEEEQKDRNLKRKNELLEQLRALVEAAETKNSADKLKAIQSEWKALGAVPASDAQQLWNSYHALLDKFYNNRSIFFELKELDRKKNLQQKLQLCERAESLLQNPSINASLQELRHLHEEWKNIGPVPNESRDIIWERFIQASEKVHERKKEYLNGRKAQEQENLQKKLMVLEVIAPYQTFNSDRINDWRDKTDEIQKIKDQWDKIGLVPKENADEVNKRFWSSYKAFYQHKNAFFKQLDEQKMQNLRHKTELCEQAEALKDSTDWDATKERLIQLQKKWKTIGRVPDKYSDKIWNRFRAACNEFFDRKQNQQQQKEADLERAASEKSAFYDTIATRLSTAPNTAGSIEEFNSILTEWRSFDDQGNRPNPKLEERFFDLLQKYLDTIPEMGYEEKSDLLFKLQLDRLRNHPDAGHKLYQKEQNIRKEISTLENDISTLRTNIEFFARSKNAEKLRTEYQARIDDANTRMATLKRQLKALRS